MTTPDETGGDVSESKACSKCGETKALSEFSNRADAPDGLQGVCRLCRRTVLARKTMRRDAKHPDSLRRKGLPATWRDDKFSEQGGVCAVCGTTDPDDLQFNQFAIDHDHGCSSCTRGCPACVRGLLCRPCNQQAVVTLERETPEVLSWLALGPEDSIVAATARYLLFYRQ